MEGLNLNENGTTEHSLVCVQGKQRFQDEASPPVALGFNNTKQPTSDGPRWGFSCIHTQQLE